MIVRQIGAVMALTLASCGTQASENAVTSANGATEASGTPAAAVQKADADTGTKPAPGELKTFKDWTVGCDNVGACKATALAPEDGDMPGVLASISREPGANGQVTFAALSSEMIPLPLRVAIDGKAVGEGGRTDDDATRIEGDLARRIVAAAANGSTLSIADGQKLGSSDISLAGLSAALRYMDAQQGLAGSTAAFVAKGPAAPTPPARTMPIVVATTPGGEAQQPTPAQLAQMNKTAQCEMPDGADASPEVAALGGRQTLVILPCSAGAYNVIGALFVIGPEGVRPAEVDAPSGFDETGADSQTPVVSVVNGGFEDGLLTSFAKGRGLGDCGVGQKFAWDGRRFRLVQQEAMGECRGSTDYITTWRAKVVRR